MSFRTKTILGIALIQAALLFILIANSLSFLRSSNEQALAQRAATAVSLVASSARDAVLTFDVASLDSLVWVTLANEGLVYARVISANKSVLAQAGDAAALSRPFVEDHRVEEVADGVFDIRAEIREAQALFGYVDLGLSVGQIETLLVAARRQMAVTALLAIALTALFSLMLGVYLTRQLHGLARASRQIAQGDFDYRLPIRSQDELGQTARAFNRMSERLRTLYDELRVALDAAHASRQSAMRNEGRIRNLLV